MHRAIAAAKVSPGVQSLLKRGFPFAVREYQLKLNQLIPFLPEVRSISGNKPNIVYNAVTFDSREVRPGAIYVALQGTSVDGHDFIPNAIENGATAIIGTSGLARDTFDLPVPYIRVSDSRCAMAWAAAALYNFPARDLVTIGVTGTDGKTTTSTILYYILKEAGFATGMITTVAAMINGVEIDTGFHVTTPESPDVHRFLAEMRDSGVTHVVLEVTSHGLAQQRVAAVDFDIAVVTNITHEHLDYHKTREDYFAAKAILFEGLGKRTRAIKPLAILNLDDPDSYRFLEPRTAVKKVCYSAEAKDQEAFATIGSLKSSPGGLELEARFREMPNSRDNQAIRVHSSLIGKYNAANILAAMSAAIYGLGVIPETAAAGVAKCGYISGRMELISMGQDFFAMVDFAHTPNALAKALDSARGLLMDYHPARPDARIIAIFGSAGLRDREKRRMMPAVAAKKADIMILTAEDPRTESLEEILGQMAEEAEASGGKLNETYYVEPDRGNAIRLGVRLARAGDLVVALGKGHEQSMCFERTEYPWDDRAAMRAALAERMGVPGPAMPYLPTSAGR